MDLLQSVGSRSGHLGNFVRRATSCDFSYAQKVAKDWTQAAFQTLTGREREEGAGGWALDEVSLSRDLQMLHSAI